MVPGTSLIQHEDTFDTLVQSLDAIGKHIDDEELVILYANSLPMAQFGTWIQAQMAFIDNVTLTEFKGRVREEARRLNHAGLSEGLQKPPQQNVEADPDQVAANLARQKKSSIKCDYCGYARHIQKECYKRIAEEYNAKQANRSQRG